ncbi:receptor-like protein kinase [Gossypium australe]|uniref:Receptor-like protein kinase n=1 Tax=Gossypium australe TaxID=47621 RepID=A0A5B6WTE1_9ROSI|nr:receptor-like protein kinase [Gossypium australe]
MLCLGISRQLGKVLTVGRTELKENQIHGVDLVRETEEKVFLKVSPWKKVLRFSRKGKLSPRFIRPYEITERIGPLEKIHDVFHVSTLRRYRSDPLHVITSTEVKIQPDMTYGEELVKILAREVKQHGVEDATWEPDEAMRNQYPNFFTSKIFGDENP